MPLSLMPDYIYQQFTADGKPLSGGTIYFYQSGTLTPKTVYADAAGSTPLGTSVVLSTSGTAVIFLDSGAYRIWIKDSAGAPVAPWVDGIVSGGGFGVAGSNATVGYFMLYNDLRALSVGPDRAFVCGNTAEGDGGEGEFQLQPGDTTADDGGIFLTAAGGSLVYKRVFDAAINPEWYGVHYNVNADQSAALVAALGGSEAVNLPVLASKRVYLTQNVAVPIGASLIAGDDGFFNSPGSITMTFPGGSRFDAQGVTFGNSVQPLFAAGVIDSLRLSWFGGIDSDKWTRLLASTSASFPLLMDLSTTLTSDLTIPANLALEPVGGAVVTFDGAANLSIGTLNHPPSTQFASFVVDTYVGSVYIGNDLSTKPEWFGAIGDGVADDSLPLYVAAKTGLIFLSHGKVYRQDTSWPLIPAILKMEGLGSFHLGAGITLGNGYLFLYNCKIFQDAPGVWFSGVYLHASNAFFPSTFTATDKFCSGCTYTDDSRAPMFDGNPALKNAHLPLITSAQFLGTDASGKIIEGIKDISLDSLNVIRLILASLSSNSSHIDVSSSGITLENPLPLFCAVNSLFTHNTITLPIPVKSNKDPNLVFFFRRGLYDGSDFKLHSQHGNFSRTGTADSEEWSDYMIAYYDFDGPGWVTFGSR